MRIGKIISTYFANSRLFIKILGLGANDVKTPDNCLPFGIDNQPTNNQNYKCIYSETGVAGQNVIIGIINLKAIADVGELHLYSEESDGTESFRIKLRNNSTCEIGGNTNYAVKYNELKTEYQALQQSLNNLITAFNEHVHSGGTISGLTGISSPVPSLIPATLDSSDITQTKNNKILTL